MIRNLLATTAVATLIASGAFAQTQPAPADPAAPAAPKAEPMAPAVTPADGFLASNMIGETVYNGKGDKAENIGDVNDLVVGKDGNLESIIIGVGGFLGIGEKNVALAYDKIKWAEKDGDRWIVVDATKDELKALPSFDRKPYDVQPAPATAMDTTGAAPAAPATAKPPATADQPATAEAPAAKGDKPVAKNTPTDNSTAATDETKTAAIDKSKLKEIPTGEIHSKDLVGTTVYGANDENIGKIGDIVLSADGKVDSIIGGFLGIGAKGVAVGMDNLSFMTDENGKRYLYTTFTKEQLNAAAAYDKSTYAQKREEQRLIMKQ
jgi:sporulation protein YlmC with PRC-barrel domain